MSFKYLSVAICLCPLLVSVALADVPQMINYQGKLTTPTGALIDTTIPMTFAIYTDSIGTDSLWSETQSSVVVEKGIFSVLLGSVNQIPDSVFTGVVRYLGVKTGDDSEMSPRKAIVSVGFAFNSDMLDGRHAGNEEGSIPVNDANLNVNLNADLLDGFDSHALMSPVKQVIRDTIWIVTGARTKDFTPSIDPTKSVVLLGQTLSSGCFRVVELTSSSITIIWYGGTTSVVIDYQIIEYR